MSRLIVKNLPPYLTPDGLRKHFAQNGAPSGTITDIKISHKPDGTSRRFGFVGFKTDKEATAARDWFDKTFVDSTRISVAVVDRGTKDAPAPRPNKRRRIDVDQSTVSKEPYMDFKGKKQQVSTETKKTTQLDAFLEVSRPRKGPSWANEAKESHPVLPHDENHKQHETEVKSQDNRDNDAISDLEWMKRRMTQQVSEPEVFQQDEDEDGTARDEAEPPPMQDKDPMTETILQTARLFLRNLAFSCTDTELHELFRPFGEVEQVSFLFLYCLLGRSGSSGMINCIGTSDSKGKR
ncbi:hypothetical protein J3A83DRAFT_4218429 [Scleroderma citrinum]